MTTEGQYIPSTLQFAADQVALYESTNGAEGNTLRDVPVIILTTRGAKTGAIRKSPLMRVEHGGKYAVVASMGGAPKHPLWYHNLIANPDDVKLQDGATVYNMRVRELTGDEKAEWWARATEVWPDYDAYQARTERVIPILLLEPR
ncbi:MAG TPA: nitroreductase family deazaflavin-dependent oxidoreductase [Dehalococcoidia bacterium]|nr:nitroreductase family deazaflavin-dependent oxidoreductase [Dehalococcoidia bacterium]